MKAHIPTIEQTFLMMNQAAVLRAEIITMLILRETFGFGAERMTRFVEQLRQESDEYESYAKGGIGDEKLLARAEKAGIPVDKQIADFLRRTEAEAFRRGLK